MKAVGIIGSALAILQQRQLQPRAQQLLCDADDKWVDGMLLYEQMRKIEADGITHSSFGIQRIEKGDAAIVVGITRLPNGSFSEV